MIDARTQLLFMVGHPVAQTKTPALLNAWFEQQKLPVVMVPADVAPDKLAEFMIALQSMRNAWGAVFTIPHKAEASRHMQRLSGVSQCLQAINVCRKTAAGHWEGDILDGLAVVDALGAANAQVKGSTVHIVGCGGAGSAAAYNVAACGAASVTVYDPDCEKTSALVQRLKTVFPACDFRAGRDGLATARIVINASPLGMQTSDLLPFEAEAVGQDTVVVDSVTSNSSTRLIAACEMRGLKVINGNMLAKAQQPLLLEYLLGNIPIGDAR